MDLIGANIIQIAAVSVIVGVVVGLIVSLQHGRFTEGFLKGFIGAAVVIIVFRFGRNIIARIQNY